MLLYQGLIPDVGAAAVGAMIGCQGLIPSMGAAVGAIIGCQGLIPAVGAAVDAMIGCQGLIPAVGVTGRGCHRPWLPPPLVATWLSEDIFSPPVKFIYVPF